MTALRTRLGRTKENFWSVAMSILAGIVTFVVTDHGSSSPSGRPHSMGEPYGRLLSRGTAEPWPSNHHHVPPAHDPPGPAAPAARRPGAQRNDWRTPTPASSGCGCPGPRSRRSAVGGARVVGPAPTAYPPAGRPVSRTTRLTSDSVGPRRHRDGPARRAGTASRPEQNTRDPCPRSPRPCALPRR